MSVNWDSHMVNKHWTITILLEAENSPPSPIVRTEIVCSEAEAKRVALKYLDGIPSEDMERVLLNMTSAPMERPKYIH